MASTLSMLLLSGKFIQHPLDQTRLLCPPIKTCFNVFQRAYLSEQTQTDHSSDVFGTLSDSGRKKLAVKAVEHLTPDDADGYDKEEIDLTPRKHAFYYKYEIKKYAKQGKFGIKRALELFHEMKSVARLTPTDNQLIPLIHGCGRAGLTKKAFELFEEWMRRETKPTKSIVTSLALACSECPFPEYGLQRLDWLVDCIKTTYNMKLNEIHYHSIIKAYGKLGRLDKAAEMLQDMIDNGVHPNTDTINMLLIGCNSNQESGTLLALRLFKRLEYYNMKPEVYTYNLLARCIRTCKLGSPKVLEQAINEMPALSKLENRIKYRRIAVKLAGSKEHARDKLAWLPLATDLGTSFKKILADSRLDFESTQPAEIPQARSSSAVLKRESESTSHTLTIGHQDLPLLSSSHQIPNLLTDDPLVLVSRVRSINLPDEESAQSRLMLFGGIHGFLESMTKDGCTPSIVTFYSLLQCIPGDEHSLLEYLRLAEDYKIKKDLFFYDSVIKHVCLQTNRPDRLNRVFQLIDDMQLDGVRPSISTYEALAFACDNWPMAKRLLDDLDRAGVVISHTMIGRFFKRAVKLRDYHYLNNLIDLSKRLKFQPSTYLVEKLEECRLHFNDRLLARERSNVDEMDMQEVTRGKMFCKRMKDWLSSTAVLDEEHPWAQFDAPSGSRRDEFQKFEEKYRLLNKVKWSSITQGKPLGNIAKRATEIMEEEKLNRLTKSDSTFGN